MKRENGNTVWIWALAFGAGVALCGMGVRFWCGSPNTGITQMGIRELIPPVWLMSLLWMLWYFLLGAVLGAVLYTYGKNCIGAWRGTCFFLLMIFLGFLWYPLFFFRQQLVLSLLVIVLTALMCALCALHWQCLSLGAGAVLWLHLLWLLYMLILQIVCLLNV